MIYCLKLFFLYEGYMVYKCTILYNLILMEGPCSYTAIVGKTIDILLFIGICWTIFRHAYTWVVKKQ